MIIGMHLGNGYGSQPGAWRMPGVDPRSYASFDAKVRHAQAAERGKLQFLFLPDGPSQAVEIDEEAPNFNLDVMLTLAAVARETSRIGLVATGSTTFNEPYNLPRQFKALDVMSRGRAGWSAVTSSGDDFAANYGQRISSSADRYSRAHEVVQLVQALWGRWGVDAWVHDQVNGQFARGDQIAPINLGGKYVASRGPLYIPPSEQGQPVIFHAGGSPNAHDLAGRYASAVIDASFTIEESRYQRAAFRGAAERARRDPDEIKYIPGLMTTIAKNRRTALDRRIAMTGRLFPARVAYLQQKLGVRLDPARLDAPLSREQLTAARPSPRDPRSAHALAIAREGWSLRDVPAHGVIDYHPVIAGPAVEAADHMQEWFESGAADGFWISPDVYEDGIDAFVDGVIPILQERGLFHRDYDSTTLRGHLGARPSMGLIRASSPDATSSFRKEAIMKIGIIGTGNIGGTLAHKLRDAGHDIGVANSRGVEGVRPFAQEVGADPVDVRGAVENVDAVILSIPFPAIADLPKDLFANLPEGVPVIDTGNYYPGMRDPNIPEIDEGMVESLWVSRQINRPVIKAFNNILAYSLAELGRPAGAGDRLAIAVAGDDPHAKSLVCGLVNEVGFDPVDAGELAESWRFQPSTPAYCCDFDAEETRRALAAAIPGEAPPKRDRMRETYAALGPNPTHADIVASNRVANAPTAKA